MLANDSLGRYRSLETVFKPDTRGGKLRDRVGLTKFKKLVSIVTGCLEKCCPLPTPPITPRVVLPAQTARGEGNNLSLPFASVINFDLKELSSGGNP